MPRLINLSDQIGKTYNRLTIIADHGVVDGSHFVIARCRCGVEKRLRFYKVKAGLTRSCGCFGKETRNITHGLSKHPLFGVWSKMRNRCSSKKNEAYSNYGGRGISVCPEWDNDFQSFYDWCTSNNWNNKLEIDRIDNDGNYEPSNCRLVNHTVNNRNKRTNRLIKFNGEVRVMTEWAEITGVSTSNIRRRMDKKGWSADMALTTPIKHYQTRKTIEA